MAFDEFEEPRKYEKWIVGAIAGVLSYGLMVWFGGSDKDRAQQTLDDLGFTEIAHEGKSSWQSCPSIIAHYRDRFNARSATGADVEVIVCRGAFSQTGSARIVKQP